MNLTIWEIFKSVFDYTQAIITKKPTVIIIYITCIIALSTIDSVLPKDFVFINIFISALWALVSNSFLIKIGQLVNQHKELVSFEKALKEVSILSFFTEKIPQSVGMTIGNALVFFIVFLGEAVVLNFSGFLKSYYNTKNHDIFDINYTPSIMIGVLFVLITLSIISYVTPYVYAGVYVSDNFKEAFIRVFDLISLGVWKKCFNLRYFFDVSMWLIYSIMVFVMILPLMFYSVVAFIGFIIMGIYIIQFPMFSVMLRYWR